MSKIDSGFFKNENTWLKGNTLRFGNLTTSRVIPEFIKSIQRATAKFNHKTIILDFSEVKQVYTSVIVPVSGYIDYFQSQRGINFEFINIPNYLENIRFNSPFLPTITNTEKKCWCLDKIWVFNNSDDIFLITNGILNNIRKSYECQKGVLDSCEWGLNEIMDNVIRHSEIKKGFILAQLTNSKKTLEVCIFDYGLGIFNTLKKTEHNPKNAVDAISMSVKEGVTRDKTKGQGNGMWGLFNMVTFNSGQLRILSGTGGIIFKPGDVQTINKLQTLSKKYQATSVNFRINLDKTITIKEVLGGYEMTHTFEENLENINDEVVFSMLKESMGTGTRERAVEIRNEILNIMQRTDRIVLVDFKGIGLVSSSFIDELFGNLIIKLGFYHFQNRIRIIGMNQSIQMIYQHSLEKRLNENNN